MTVFLDVTLSGLVQYRHRFGGPAVSILMSEKYEDCILLIDKYQRFG
jgi:hypothetical protein